MSSYSVKIFSGYKTLENRLVSTLQEDNGCTTAKFEFVWPLHRATTVPMNESKRPTQHMTVSPIAFRHSLRFPTAPTHAQARGVRPYLLVFHRHNDLNPSGYPRFTDEFASTDLGVSCIVHPRLPRNNCLRAMAFLVLGVINIRNLRVAQSGGFWAALLRPLPADVLAGTLPIVRT